MRVYAGTPIFADFDPRGDGHASSPLGVCPDTIITTYFSDPVHNLCLIGMFIWDLNNLLVADQIVHF